MDIAEQFRVAAAKIESREDELCWTAMNSALIPSRYRGEFGEIFEPAMACLDDGCLPYYAWRATALCFAAAMIETGDFK